MTDLSKSQNQTTKIKSYLGFAKKSGNIKIGSDNILSSKKIQIIIVSESASDNTINKLNNFAIKVNAQFCLIDKQLATNLFDTDTIKAVGITDKSLADACKNCLEKYKETVLKYRREKGTNGIK